MRRELGFERRYRWNRTDQRVQQIHTDATPTTPGEKYSQYLWGYDAAGQITQWSLAPDGLPLARTVALGHQVKYEYDLARRGEAQWQRARYQFDSLGRLTAGINHGGRVELEWDPAGQLTLERNLIRGSSYELHHQYGELGNRTVTALPDGTGKSQWRVITPGGVTGSCCRWWINTPVSIAMTTMHWAA